LLRSPVAVIATAVSLAACGSASGGSQTPRNAVERIAVTARGTDPPALAETARAPALSAPRTFLSLWSPSRKSGPVLEQFSLDNGRALRQLATVPENASQPEAGPDNSIWLTMSTGPRLRNNTAGGDPEPDSCSGSVVRLNLDSGTTQTVLTAASSQKIYDAVPSPDGRLLVMETGSCNRSYFNEHLLVKELQSGRQWTIGADAAPCHEISTPSWHRGGTELAFVYGPATGAGVPETPRNDLGEGICSSLRPGEVATIPALHASQLSSARLIAPPKECSYETAVFDAWGIAATEGCEKGTARGFKGFGEDRGDCYLVQLNSRGQVTARFPLRREPNPTRLASSPSGALVLVTEENGENTRPYWDWIWAFNGHLLRLVGHYDADVTAIP
jgi:hypothetical protein